MKTVLILCVAGLLRLPVPAGGNVATNAAEVFAATIAKPRDGVAFDLTATVTYCRENRIVGVRDGSGLAVLFPRTNAFDRLPVPGDRVRARGVTEMRLYDAHAECTSIETLGHGPAPDPLDVPLPTLYARNDAPMDFDGALVRTGGTVSDIFRDEIDSRYIYVILSDGVGSVCVTCGRSRYEDFRPEKLIGRKVTVVGVCHKSTSDQPRRIHRALAIFGPENISFSDPDDADPFAAEEIPSGRAVPAALKRYRARGRVTAVWQGGNVMLDTGRRWPVWIRLLAQDVPAFGEMIEAVGFPENDIFQIALAKAVWRRIPDAPTVERAPRRIRIADLLSDGKGVRQVHTSYNGLPVVLSGRVATLPPPGGDGRFIVESDGVFIQADASACPEALDGLPVGATVELRGICVTETEINRAPWTVPRAKDNILVLRQPGDIRILARPPWWTPARLLTVIVTLALLAAGFAVLCVLFRRLAERRGKELSEESVRRAEADFKTYERTRLAVELHDSLSQNLSGLSMELDAVSRLSDGTPPKLREHLDLAMRGLNACRTELKGCLWDLRNNTLELDSADEAIRRTVEPHLGDARLSVRFSVPRERISDNTMHTILKIIRELVSNAVRHGKATAIRVAGSIEGDRLLFSVQDDGIGFDPAQAPGIETGHFGLQGIWERIDALNGELELRSEPGRGTKATLSLRIRKESDQ